MSLVLRQGDNCVPADKKFTFAQPSLAGRECGCIVCPP
jgi:hypothetical protein